MRELSAIRETWCLLNAPHLTVLSSERSWLSLPPCVASLWWHSWES